LFKNKGNPRRGGSGAYFEALNASRTLLKALKYMGHFLLWASIAGVEPLTEFYGKPVEELHSPQCERQVRPLYLPAASSKVFDNNLVAYFGLAVVDAGFIRAFNCGVVCVLASYHDERRGVEVSTTYIYPPKSLGDILFFALNRGVRRVSFELARSNVFPVDLELVEASYKMAPAEPLEINLQLEQYLPRYYKAVSLDTEVSFLKPVESKLAKVALSCEFPASLPVISARQGVQVTLVGFNGRPLKYRTDLDERAVGELMWAFISENGLFNVKSHANHILAGLYTSINVAHTLTGLRTT